MADTPEEIERDIADIAQISAIPNILQILCEITGMGFAAVARVSDTTWTACAVRDEIEFGLLPGGQLELASTLCTEVRSSGIPIVFDCASADPVYRDHHTPRLYGLESYISVPIQLPSGEYFGNLCAIDSKPAQISSPRIVSTFQMFAELIGFHLQSLRESAQTREALRHERATGLLREEFIGILGHDLRNPLAGISGCAALMQRSADPVTRDLARRVSANVRRMSSLVDDLLDLTRGRLGSGMTVRLEPVHDMGAALESVVAELRDAHPGRLAGGIAVVRSLRCDRGRIQQVFSNLLANALTHGSPHEPVEFAAASDPQGLSLRVSNRGAPIPAELQARLFQPFQRRPGDERGGLGLGLYICAEIVAAHQGQIEVSSTADGGTTFLVHIPS